MHSRLIYLLVLSWLSIGAAGFAQGAASTAPSLVRAKLSFILVAGAEPMEGLMIEGPRKQTVPIRVNSVTKSLPYDYEGLATMRLYVPDSTTPARRKAVGVVELPRGARNALILLAPGPATATGGATYVGTAVTDDLADVPLGSLRFLNYSGKQLMLKVNEQSFELGKGASKPIKVATADAAAPEASVDIATAEGDRFVPAYRARIPCRPTERQTLILMPSTRPKGRGITVVPIRDMGAPAPAAPGAKAAPSKD